MEEASSVSRIRLKETSLISHEKGRSMFDIKMSLQLTVSLLLNDIRNFASLYKTFRDTHFEFFDLEHEESELGRNGCTEGNPNIVPCDPMLSKDHYLLELIDSFRYCGEAHLLDELMQAVIQTSSESSDEEVI